MAGVSAGGGVREGEAVGAGEAERRELGGPRGGDGVGRGGGREGVFCFLVGVVVVVFAGLSNPDDGEDGEEDEVEDARSGRVSLSWKTVLRVRDRTCSTQTGRSRPGSISGSGAGLRRPSSRPAPGRRRGGRHVSQSKPARRTRCLYRQPSRLARVTPLARLLRPRRGQCRGREGGGRRSGCVS